MAVGFAVAFLAISFLFVSFTLLFCSVVLIFDLRKRYAHIPGPPINNFIWGSCREFEENRGKRAKHVIFEDLVHMYGPVIVTWDIHRPIVTVADTRMLNGAVDISDFKDYISNGEFSTIFDQRFLGSRAQYLCGFEPVFDKACAKRHLKHFNSCCKVFLENLQTLADGKTEVKMAAEFEKLAVNVIGKIAFGINLNCMQDPDMPFYKALQECQHAIHWSRLHPLHKWNILTFEYQNDVIEAVKYLRDFAKKVIDRRRTDLANGEMLDDDYLTNMLAAVDENAVVTFDGMLDEFVAVFISGHCQVTSLLSNILCELLLHPSIEERVYEEVINVISSNNQVTFDNLDQLKLISCIHKETARLHPPVSSVKAQLRESAKITNYSVPKTSTIQLIPYLTQTNPDSWEKPKDFIPERFLGEIDVTIESLFPHALRKHNYLNSAFAECLVKVIFPCLLNKFKFTFKADQDVAPTADLMSLPTDGVICSLTQM